jgi:predicted kinase
VPFFGGSVIVLDVPRLIHRNGPPGIGKSTVARRYVQDRPLAFCLDIDDIRREIGGWDTQVAESGYLARRMALVMLREHLSSGHDVVVPQFAIRQAFIAEMSALATDIGVAFFEVVLDDDLDSARSRFDARAGDPILGGHHQEAVRQIERSGGFTAMYEALDDVRALADTRVVTTTAGQVEGAYSSLLDVLS